MKMEKVEYIIEIRQSFRLYYRMIHFGEPTQGHLPWADGELQEAIKSIQWQRLGDFRLSNWSASDSFFTAGTGDCVNGQILLAFIYGSTGIISSYNGQVTIGTFSVNEDGTITTPDCVTWKFQF